MHIDNSITLLYNVCKFIFHRLVRRNKKAPIFCIQTLKPAHLTITLTIHLKLMKRRITILTWQFAHQLSTTIMMTSANSSWSGSLYCRLSMCQKFSPTISMFTPTLRKLGFGFASVIKFTNPSPIISTPSILR